MFDFINTTGIRLEIKKIPDPKNRDLYKPNQAKYKTIS